MSDPQRNPEEVYPPSEYPFHHYGLRLSLYKDDLTGYAIGRLVRRLEWHHVQWLVLLAESSCEHRLSQVGSRSSSEKEGSSSESKNEDWTWSERERAVSILEDAVCREQDRQWRLAERVSNQLQEAVHCLRTEATVPLSRRVTEFCEQLLAPDVVPFKENADEVALELRGRSEMEDFDHWCDEGLKSLLSAPSHVPLDQLNQALRNALPGNLDDYFRLGCAVEEGLCPLDVFRLMALSDCKMTPVDALLPVPNLYLAIAPSAGFNFGFCSFAPGALRLSRRWRENCKSGLDFAGLADESLVSSLAPSRTCLLTHAGAAPFGELDDISFCCWPALTRAIAKVASLHDAIIRLSKGQSEQLTPVQSMDGLRARAPAFDLDLMPTSGRMLLRRENYDPVAIPFSQNSQIRLLHAIIKRNGDYCALDTLLEFSASVDSLYKAIGRLNSVLKKVHLCAKNKRDQGYCLSELGADDTA